MRRRTAGSREADPAHVSNVLRDLVGHRGWARNLAFGTLRARWAEIVGPQIAARSEPLKLEEGRLTIRVEGGAWASELALLSGPIRDAVTRFLGPDFIREVAVVAGAPRLPKAEP